MSRGQGCCEDTVEEVPCAPPSVPWRKDRIKVYYIFNENMYFLSTEIRREVFCHLIKHRGATKMSGHTEEPSAAKEGRALIGLSAGNS